MLQLTKLKIQQIASPDQQRGELIERIQNRLTTYNPPKNFNGAQSEEIQHDKQFNDMCMLISQNLNADATKMSVMQFYGSLELMRKQYKEQKKMLNKNKNRH